MEADPILSFSAPSLSTERVQAMPAPVLELLYAAYFLSCTTPFVNASWADEVRTRHPDLVAELKGFWQKEPNPAPAGKELLILACGLGYAADGSPERFFRDLPDLPARFSSYLERDEEQSQAPNPKLQSRLEALQDEKTMSAYRKLYQRLWEALAPIWEATGREAVEAECERFRKRLAAGRGVLSALPPHHFSRFECYAELIARFSERGEVYVLPLYFSASGGFVLDIAESVFVGYGLETEGNYRQLAMESKEVAAKIKALADPTRLLIFTLISRYEVTVSDLVVQLNVTQPTVSGHLKILREAELVDVSKKGTKSFYTVRAEVLQEALTQLTELLGLEVQRP